MSDDATLTVTAANGVLANDTHDADDALHVTTKLTRTDYGHLSIQATIDDPKAYAKPWTTTSVTAALVPDTELMEFICLENEKDTRRR